MTHEHVVLFSGGFGSWAAARRLRDRLGPGKEITLLFTDTLIEDEDLYRFLEEAAANVDGNLVRIADGRTPWQVFKDERFLGNSRLDPCSKILKRNLSRKWIKEHCDPEEATLYVGITIDEEHRFKKIQPRWEPYRIDAPMCEEPYLLLAHEDRAAMMRDAGLEPPRLYAMGFPHNNCGGFCIKAGQAHFANLLEKMPRRYAHHEREESKFREWIGKDVTILRDRRGGTVTPLTLKEFRERHESQPTQTDLFDWGGCGCFAGSG